MPEIRLGNSSKNRKTNWTPRLRCVNTLVEQSKENGFTGIDHIQRPGLAEYANVGDGPVRGLFRQAGTFNGDLLVVSGEELYRVDITGADTLIGDLPGQLMTTSAGTATRVIFESDGVAYSTDGTTVVEVVMPDDRPVGSVDQLNGYFLLTDLTPTSARVYYIPPGSVDPDGLDYFATESVPGTNTRIKRVGDELWIFKQEGTEVHVSTGDADLPFQRVPGRNYDKGLRNVNAVCAFDNTVGFVGDDAIVYRGDALPIRISDETVEEKMRKATPDSLRVWSFVSDGHTLLVIISDVGTVVYDVLTQQWSEFQSWNRPTFRGQCAEDLDTFTVVGDDETGKVYRLDQELSTDDGDPMLRIVPGIVPVAGGSVTVDNIDLFITTGTASNPTDNFHVAVSWSDNLQDYVSPRLLQLGRQGQYGKPVRMNRLGKMNYPGRLYEFAVTDDVKITISGAAFNIPLR